MLRKIQGEPFCRQLQVQSSVSRKSVVNPHPRSFLPPPRCVGGIVTARPQQSSLFSSPAYFVRLTHTLTHGAGHTQMRAERGKGEEGKIM